MPPKFVDQVSRDTMDNLSAFDHVAFLQHRAKLDGNSLILKLPKLRGAEPTEEWTDITVARLAADVNAVALLLTVQLKPSVAPRSVVSVWFPGYDYDHLVYVLALTRASYVPQMFCESLANSGIVFELMEKAGSKAIIYDNIYESLMTDCPFPKMPLLPIAACLEVCGDGLPNIDCLSWSDEDICFILHTSGSTSGSPKLVPATGKYLKVLTKKHIMAYSLEAESRDAFLGRGCVCHVPSIILYLGCLYTGAYFVQASKMRLSPEELVNMVKTCHVNHLTQFGTFLSLNIKAARADPIILKLLQGMKTVSYDGVPISHEDDGWCFKNHVPLVNMYANTECGIMMTTVPGKPARFIRPVEGLSCRFDNMQESATLDNPSTVRLLELVVLPDSPEFPQPHLLAADGNFRTGDLFEKQADGSYLYRGRDDDWIKDAGADRCDTRSIETQVRETSGDLIKDCVVVGNYRPSPVLFVEIPKILPDITPEILKEIILKRMKDFNDRRYQHERITDKRLISVVPESTLPRTGKGNIKRKVVEEMYSMELDAMYLSVYGY